MAVDELNFRKKQLVQELNGFIGLKKAYTAQAQQRSELIGQSTPQGPTQEELNGETTWRCPAVYKEVGLAIKQPHVSSPSGLVSLFLQPCLPRT